MAGSSPEAVGESTRALRHALLVGVPLLVAVVALGTWRLVGGTLRPVEEGLRRQRDFVADASHDLQSPLAALRAELEVALAGREDDWPAVGRGLLATVDEMERLVGDLLFLAKPPGVPDGTTRGSTSTTWCSRRWPGCARAPP